MGIHRYFRLYGSLARGHAADARFRVHHAFGSGGPVASLDVPHFMSWADAERDLTAWLGNDMQNDAIESVYRLEKAVKVTGDPGVLRTWRRLQTSDHFYYMSTKWFSDGDVHSYFNPYGTPYDAYINYMNVLADFRLTLDAASPLDPGTKSAVLESA